MYKQNLNSISPILKNFFYKNMAFYEHTIVGKQDLSDKEMKTLIDKYSKIFDKSGKILKTEKWGLLNLANKIKEE